MITKIHKISMLSPRLDLGIKQSLISQLQCDLPVKICPANTINDLFLNMTKSLNDFVFIDVEELFDQKQIFCFEIIQTLTTLSTYSSSKNKLIIVGLVNESTDSNLIKYSIKELNGHVMYRYVDNYDCILESIQNLINDRFVTPKQIISLIKSNKKLSNNNIINLTPRQRQIMQIISSRGSSNKIIAKMLGISESTVKLHISSIFKKYGVKNRTQLAVFSKEHIIN